MTPYRPSLRKRVWWWWTRQLDRLHIWRRTREMNARAHATFLVDHPDYAAALKARDRKSATVILERIIAEGQAGFVATPGFRRFLRGRLESAGYSEADIATTDQMLKHYGEGGRAN